jgi:phosphopantothenoylcysteine synthetase/decarboxylase
VTTGGGSVTNVNRSAVTLVVGGAPLASRAADLRAALSTAGWSVTVVRSTAAAAWTSPDNPDTHADTDADVSVGVGVGVGDGQERRRPDVVVVCPLTFNTANKITAGVMDTPATGTLCDALGAGVPIIAVPMANTRLWGHPVWATTLTTLQSWGVVLLDPTTGRLGDPRPVDSGTGDAVAAAFDPRWILAAVGPAPSCG